MLLKIVKGKDLQLGDIVRSDTMTYNNSTVIKINKDSIVLFRPYVHTNDFESTAGIIPYLGFEQWESPIDTDWTLVERRSTPIK